MEHRTKSERLKKWEELLGLWKRVAHKEAASKGRIEEKRKLLLISYNAGQRTQHLK
jgi:hypothetical protein